VHSVTGAASDHRVFQHLGVRSRAGYGAADVAARGRRRVRERQLSSQLRLAFFKLNFLQKFQTEVNRTLNTKVEQVTLYNICKG
jgi:hypothetical protein